MLQHGLTIDLHFDAVPELKKAFSIIQNYIPDQGPIFEFNLKIHWKIETKTDLALVEVQRFTQQLQPRLKPSSAYVSVPYCFGDKAQYAPFPSCADCAFLAANWCQWPPQMNENYPVTQRAFSHSDRMCFTKKDFEVSPPITWFYPKKNQMHLAARQLSKSDVVFDFGCGNGFVTYLFQQEIPEKKFFGIEPFGTEPFGHAGANGLDKHDHYPARDDNTKKICFLNSLPDHMPDSWSLISSLADFHVPLEMCLRKNTLPRDIVFIRFPYVFGNPGRRLRLVIKNGALVESTVTDLFSLGDLDGLGYQRIHREPVDSHFFENAELLIYSRIDNKLADHANINFNKFYSWEKSSAFSNDTTSEVDLS